MSERNYFKMRREVKCGAGCDITKMEVFVSNTGAFVGCLSRHLSCGEEILRAVIFRDPSFLGRAFDFFDEEVRKAEFSGKNPEDYTYHSLEDGRTVTNLSESEFYDSERTSKFLHNEVERLEKRNPNRRETRQRRKGCLARTPSREHVQNTCLDKKI